MARKYITTPLYYVNDKPHIGHAYTTIAADALARFYRLTGHEVFFLTGTDEHGMKIEEAAQAANLPVHEFVNGVARHFQDAWKTLLISNDGFIRTTEQRHHETVQGVIRKLTAQGDVVPGKYEGWYCKPDESFWTELQVKREGNRVLCPECSRPVEKVKENTYFFKLSKYEKRLLEYLEKQPEFVQPGSRLNEVLSFVKGGLKDLSITRTTFSWGIPFPEDAVPLSGGLKNLVQSVTGHKDSAEKHVVYVWFDALINYITAPGYLHDEKNFEKWWPATVHIIGKEILRFHAVIWPIMLMALGLPLPEKVFGHGWWTVEGKKMSKSLGNVVDPLALAAEFGVDATRYFLLREVPFGSDGDFSRASLIHRFNADLANDIGNLLNRSLTMIEKYFEGKVPEPVPGAEGPLDKELREKTDQLESKLTAHMDALAFSDALAATWEVINLANTYIERSAPWTLAKAGNKEALANVMFHLAETIRVTAWAVAPFMPVTSEKILDQLGCDLAVEKKDASKLAWGRALCGQTVRKGNPLFPRIEIKS